jgi:hypothetical protein
MNFLPIKSYSQVDTFVCDNGGFEQDFLYWRGYSSTYDHGSSQCTPVTENNLPVSWTLMNLPVIRRFEIVNSGTDALVGIPKTKFGSKALLLNNRYGHGLEYSPCNTQLGIDKISKRFKVTEENREFSIWFAVVLETPTGHIDNQPFFSIKCDLAPGSDICFDAAVLDCDNNYNDPLCEFDPIQVVNWTCHRIKIDKNYIGSIATVEITAADCGENAHFGYAYIDGICEECDGSAFGSAKLYSQDYDPLTGLGVDRGATCDGDTINVCGSYDLPNVCGNWQLDSMYIQGITTHDLTIDPINHTFCFKLIKSEFPINGCKEIYAVLFFKSVIKSLPPIYTNSIEICYSDFKKYETQFSISACYSNGTSGFISDDYYYVTVDLANFGTNTWIMERQLLDPYPNESGHYILKTGMGNRQVVLGPFLIQEGDWELKIKVADCTYTYPIQAPDYCCSCSRFQNTKISNVTCNNQNSPWSSDDTWTFDLKVDYPQALPSDFYTINGVGTYLYGQTYTINGGIISQNCIEFFIEDGILLSCNSSFKVCPPKPCSTNECNIELYLNEIYCSAIDYSFHATATGAVNLCYKILDNVGTVIQNGTWPSSGNLGPFNQDIYLVVFPCNVASNNPDCFKILFIPEPDCQGPEGRSIISKTNDLQIIPNPVASNEIHFVSSLESTECELLNLSGNLIQNVKFKGKNYSINSNIPPGIYFVRYKNSSDQLECIKLIKY